ncbi:MAG: TonB family protein [Saprospiraceae bacterium]|nr:TonB family protein [Saprospiraceae bacterium]
MKYSLSMFCFSFLFASCIMYQTPSKYKANPNPYKDKFADKLEPGSTLLESTFLSTFEKTADGKYIYKEFFPETKQLILLQTYADSKRMNSEGPYKSWMDDGSPSSEGQYNNGKRQGDWTIWAGTSRSIGKYNNGEQVGLWITYNASDLKTAEMNYVAGKPHGPFKGWNEKGELVREGTYANGKLESENVLSGGEVIAPDGTYKVVEVKPQFPGCSNSNEEEKTKCAESLMLKFIYTNIKYPAVARENDVQGTAYISFVVEKDGSITNIKSIKGICMDIKNECERVVRMMPKWEPGMQKGKPVRVQFNLPIKFKLE